LKSQIEAQKEIRQYLLGTLSPERAAELEERLLIDSEVYEELLIAEDELIDQFIEGRMSPAEREEVETHFLRAPERKKQLSFSRTLKSYVSANTSSRPEVSESWARTGAPSPEPPKKRSFRDLLFPRNPVFAFSLTAALVLIIVGGVWLANRLNQTNQPQAIWAVELTPGLQRDGGEITNLAIPANTDNIRLELDLADDQFQSYQVEVLDISGRSVMTGKNLKAQTTSKGRRIVPLEVKAALLSPGDYRAKLSALSAGGKVESLDTYPFKVLRK
jgi:hypothetical protein